MACVFLFVFIKGNLHKPNHEYKVTLSSNIINSFEETITLSESEYKKTQKIIGLVEGKKLLVLNGMIEGGEYNKKTIGYNSQDPIQLFIIKSVWNPIIEKIEEKHGDVNFVTIDKIDKVPIK